MDLFLADGANCDGTPEVVMLNSFQHLPFHGRWLPRRSGTHEAHKHIRASKTLLQPSQKPLSYK
jgi:hypothetical protein